MRFHACLLATAAVLATAPRSSWSRADRSDAGDHSRPPGPAWTPGAAVAALARVATLGAEGLSTLDQTTLAQVCVPHVFGVSLPIAAALDSRCDLIDAPFAPFLTWHAPDVGALVVRLQLELRELSAGPGGFIARFLPEAPGLDFLPDLSALTTSPVPGVESSGFGWRSDPIQHRAKFHKGTDFRAKQGTPVYAAGAGRVVFTGQQHGYGNIIYVDHGGGVVTRYAHLSRFEITRGELVGEGRLIGRVGATGRATGPHLHFEVRLGARAVEPRLAMQIGLLQRTDPAAARVAAEQLAAAIQDHKIDSHDPPGRSRRVERRHRGHGRPERAGAPRRSRDNT